MPCPACVTTPRERERELSDHTSRSLEMLRARREMAMEIWRSALARKPTRDASRTARSASFFYPRVSRGETVHLHDPSLCCAGLGLLFGLGRHTVTYIYTTCFTPTRRHHHLRIATAPRLSELAGGRLCYLLGSVRRALSTGGVSPKGVIYRSHSVGSDRRADPEQRCLRAQEHGGSCWQGERCKDAERAAKVTPKV